MNFSDNNNNTHYTLDTKTFALPIAFVLNKSFVKDLLVYMNRTGTSSHTLTMQLDKDIMKHAIALQQPLQIEPELNYEQNDLDNLPLIEPADNTERLVKLPRLTNIKEDK